MKEKECKYRDRYYSVRDDGSIFRHAKEGCKPSKLDEIWTFGKKDNKSGYLLYGGVRVHQVVATAFHGSPEDANMVVDHKDTNRCNNRPENLQWVTRLENVLNNPFTRRKIEYLCGSIEAFLKDPSTLRESASDPNIAWMRTVSKDEAAKCLKNLSRWMEEDTANESRNASKGLGEWIFQETEDSFEHDWGRQKPIGKYSNDYQRKNTGVFEQAIIPIEEESHLKQSLTHNAYQMDWRIPTEFPCCPDCISKTPLSDYYANLKPGALYCHNHIYESNVFKAEMNADGSKISVLCPVQDGPTSYALSEITFDGKAFIHKSIRTFFTEEGAEKYYALSLGKEWDGGDVLEDFC